MRIIDLRYEKQCSCVHMGGQIMRVNYDVVHYASCAQGKSFLPNVVSWHYVYGRCLAVHNMYDVVMFFNDMCDLIVSREYMKMHVSCESIVAICTAPVIW